jgi:hypothetical protein
MNRSIDPDTLQRRLLLRFLILLPFVLIACSARAQAAAAVDCNLSLLPATPTGPSWSMLFYTAPGDEARQTFTASIPGDGQRYAPDVALRQGQVARSSG